MKANLVAATLIAVLASATTTHSTEVVTAPVAMTTTERTAKPVLLRNNPGGYMMIYGVKALRSQKESRLVVFEGFCLSACTMFLLVDNKCMGNNYVTFGFHLPYVIKPQPKHSRYDPESTMFLMDFYPNWVKRWIASKGGLKPQMIYMPHEYARQYIRYCTEEEKAGAKLFKPRSPMRMNYGN